MGSEKMVTCSTARNGPSLCASYFILTQTSYLVWEELKTEWEKPVSAILDSYTLESNVIVFGFPWCMVISECSIHHFRLPPSSCPFDLPGPQYRLEKQSEPNIAVDLESTLESQNAWEFCLVRENSTLAASLCAALSVANMLRSDMVETCWSGFPKQMKSDSFPRQTTALEVCPKAGW